MSNQREKKQHRSWRKFPIYAFVLNSTLPPSPKTLGFPRNPWHFDSYLLGESSCPTSYTNWEKTIGFIPPLLLKNDICFFNFNNYYNRAIGLQTLEMKRIKKIHCKSYKSRKMRQYLKILTEGKLMTWIIVFNWQHPSYYQGRRATRQACAANPLQGSAPVAAPPMKAEIAGAFATLTQFPKPTGAL